MTYTRSFQQLEKGDISLAGGKGANLGEMTTAGFPVPAGFVLTTEAYDAFVREHGLQEEIFRAASKVNADDPQAGEEASEEIQDLFLNAEISQEMADALLSAHAELEADAVAVRSSATAEDLPDASFAGQQETYLNVRGKEELLDAVRRCWASLWTARAITYRFKQGIDPAEVSLAVVVQKQVTADVSGVAFSLNPQNNSYDEAVINSNFGLGESIVSGQVTPDNFVVDKVKKEILRKQISIKDYVLVGKDGGGIGEQAVEAPDAASLTDSQAIEVAGLATRVESHYDMPMDIEWAYADGELYLLQARPITAYVPLPEVMVTKPGEEKYLYLDMIVLTQGFQDSLSVLGNEIWGRMLEAIKGDTGMLDRGMEGTILNVEGRQYMHLSNMMKGFASGTFSRMIKSYDTPTRKIIESIDLPEYTPAEQPEALRGLTWRIAKFAFGALPYVYRGVRSAEKAVQTYDKQFAQDVQRGRRLAAQDIEFQSLSDELLDYFKGQMNASISVLLPAMVARWQLRRMFKDDDVEDLLVALEMDLDGNATSEMGRQMVGLARFPEVQETQTGEEFEEKLNAKAFSPEFMRAYDDYMEKFGSRCIKEIDIATPRPYENVPEFFEQLKALDVESGMLESVAKRRAEAHEKLLALAAQKGKASQFKRRAALQKNAGYREAPKYFFIIINDLMRQRALKLGEEFMAQGRLDDAAQVFDLNIQQITRAQKDPALSLRPLIEKNLAPRKKFAHVQEWPRIIDSRGEIFRAERAPAKEGELVGDPIASGTVRGIANVLHSPYEKPLKKGEILVTRATDPGWTPLFMNTSGVVLEVGGALQHGAVIAREYGLPCVSGVGDATTSITDGQMIEVDGSNGIVRVVANA